MTFLVAVLQGAIPYVGRHEGLHRPTDATQQIRLGTKQFHGEQYWQSCVGYSIAMAKRVLNYICCKTKWS